MAKYQIVYADGCNGWRLGDVVEGRLADGVLHVSEDGEDQEATSRNGDGLFSSDEEDVLYVPLGGR